MSCLSRELIDWAVALMECATSQKNGRLVAVVNVLGYFDVVVDEFGDDVVLVDTTSEVSLDVEFLQAR